MSWVTTGLKIEMAEITKVWRDFVIGSDGQTLRKCIEILSPAS